MHGAKVCKKLIAGRRNEVFFGEKLYRVGDHRVDQPHAGEAENRRAVGADAVLDQRAALALDPTENSGEIENHEKNEKGFDRDNREIDDHVAPPPAASQLNSLIADRGVAQSLICGNFLASAAKISRGVE